MFYTLTIGPIHELWLCASSQDIEAVDPEYHKNLKWMLENDITDVLDLTFTAESDFFGKTEVRLPCCLDLSRAGHAVVYSVEQQRQTSNSITHHAQIYTAGCGTGARGTRGSRDRGQQA
jgi:HECT-domain (ubiquitin-transferase)